MPLHETLEIPPDLVGLSSHEARHRLRQAGPNRWVARDRLGWLREGIRLVLDPMALMLAAAAVIYVLLGQTRDAAVLAVALIPVLGVDVLLEARSRRALARLARAAAPTADAVRDGRVRSVAVEDVVPGDLLVIREGHVVAADGEIEWAANLSIDESLLTGESVPQPKRARTGPTGAADDSKFFAGSLAVSGHGFGRVVATGTKTTYGGIAALVGQTPPSLSPLQVRTSGLVRRLAIAALIVGLGVAALGLARGESLSAALLGYVSLAIAAIPEEFPVVLTLFLSVGAWRLASRGMLVRRLASVETLGSTTVICADKTGTLTRGEFQVTEHSVLARSMSEADFLEAAILACERHPADPMERAIQRYADARSPAAAAIATRWDLVRDHDFDAAGKHMSHVWRSRASGRVLTVAKGAVEGILAHCAIEPAPRDAVVSANEWMAARGLRVLALAGKWANDAGGGREDDERGLEMFGLLGFQDPLRPEVAGAVAECQRAGIRVKMITGDHALTAHAVAEAAGIVHDDDLIVTGDELAEMSVAERADRIGRAAIFARISPQQKFTIVDGLKRGGAIVAMTGDGVNDAPALRRADIGIAMGRRGTDVARATADLVLLDDNFASIVATVREGRHILQNIQRAFLYLIGFHTPIITLAVMMPLANLPLLLLPIHLVWLELIVHPVSALVFQAERATAAVMSQPPNNPAAPLLPWGAVTRSAVSGALLTAAVFAMYSWQLNQAGEAGARGLALVVLLAGYQTLLFAERRALAPTLSRVPRTLVFWVVWAAAAMSLVVVLALPSAAELFHVAVAPGVPLAMAVPLGMAAVSWRFIPLPRRAGTAAPAR